MHRIGQIADNTKDIMADKITFNSFFSDVVVPAAESAKQWKTAQFESCMADLCEFFASGQMDKAAFIQCAVKLSNTSALRQDLEKAGIIPSKTGDNWLSKLAKE